MKRPGAPQRKTELRRGAPMRRTGTALARKTPMKQRSDKTRELYEKVRRPLVRRLLAERPWCQVRWDAGCWRRATEVHEPELRSRVPGPELISDETRCLTACRHCHRAVHDHPAEATRRGFMVPSGPAKRPGEAA